MELNVICLILIINCCLSSTRPVVVLSTSQMSGLENLYNKYRKQRFTVLGFPCNQFLYQEPGSHNQISEFCHVQMKVSFPMSKKVKVNGRDTHPIFQYLKHKAVGTLGSRSLKWNFTKFLIHPDRQQVMRFSPTTQPYELERFIIDWLDESECCTTGKSEPCSDQRI